MKPAVIEMSIPSHPVESTLKIHFNREALNSRMLGGGAAGGEKGQKPSIVGTEGKIRCPAGLAPLTSSFIKNHGCLLCRCSVAELVPFGIPTENEKNLAGMVAKPWTHSQGLAGEPDQGGGRRDGAVNKHKGREKGPQRVPFCSSFASATSPF